MIRTFAHGTLFPHACPGSGCAVCAYVGRKSGAAAPVATMRGRAGNINKKRLCDCVWCLKQVGESATLEAESEGVSPPADPLPISTRNGGAAA